MLYGWCEWTMIEFFILNYKGTNTQSYSFLGLCHRGGLLKYYQYELNCHNESHVAHYGCKVVEPPMYGFFP